MQEVKLEVNTKVQNARGENEYKVVATHTIYVPLLAETFEKIGNPEQAKDDKGQPMVDDDGLPVYTSDVANWLQGAILSQVKAQARNKIDNKTGQLRPGAAIPNDWASLVAIGTGGGNGEALKIVREVRTLFEEFVLSLGKSAKTSQQLILNFSNLKALETQPASFRERVIPYVDQFISTLSDEQVARYESYLTKVSDLLAAPDEEDIDDL